MKRSSVELKGLARECLLGRYTIPVVSRMILILAPVLLTLVYEGLTGLGRSNNGMLGVLTAVIGTIVLTLLECLLEIGFSRMMMNIARGRVYSFADLIYPFTVSADRMIGAVILCVLICAVCVLPAIAAGILLLIFSGVLLQLLSLLLFLAGIVLAVIAALNYSQTFYLILDNPGYTVTEAMRASRELMKGRRFRLFYLHVSFLGLELLSLLSLNIAALWLRPYIETTCIEFYRDITGELDSL